MTDKKPQEVSKIDALYQWISYDLKRMKEEIMNELKYSSIQMGSMYEQMKADSDESAATIAQELRYGYIQNQSIFDGLNSAIGEMDEKVASKVQSLDQLQAVIDELNALKELHQQVMTGQENISDRIGEDVIPKIEALPELSQRILEAVEAIPLNENVDYNRITEEVGDRVLELLNEIKAEQKEVEAAAVDYDRIAADTSEKVLNALPLTKMEANVEIDYQRIVKDTSDRVIEALPQAAEAIDYIRIAEDTAEKVAERFPASQAIDYDRIIGGVTEKVIECLPAQERVDYNRIGEVVGDKVAGMPVVTADGTAVVAPAPVVAPVATEVDYDKIAEIVSKVAPAPIVAPAAAEVDYDRIAAILNQTNPAPVAAVAPAAEVDYDRIGAMIEQAVAKALDYDRLADVVVAKLAANTQQTCEVMLDDAGIDSIAEKVSAKIAMPEPTDPIDYDKVCLAAQAAQIVPDPVDYDRIAEIVEDKISQEATYDLVLDDEGVQAIAETVADEICARGVPCVAPAVVEETPVEKPVEEVVEEAPIEEPAEEVVEEAPIEEPAEEVVEEAPIEEPVEEVVEEAPVVVQPIVDEAPAHEELAVAVGIQSYQEVDNQLVDAETGLVIRLKRSFTAKIRQSDEKVKGYYSDLKNALTSYKRLNSNVSWHADRFNVGRETVAKINICGKTLCLYLALDPNDPEFKTTVYHQKDVSGQKAYETTPFMIKIKSDAAVKKAVRLVEALAEKLAVEKDEKYKDVDYVEEFSYQSTKQLFDEGFIKATKEKKVELDF